MWSQGLIVSATSLAVLWHVLVGCCAHHVHEPAAEGVACAAHRVDSSRHTNESSHEHSHAPHGVAECEHAAADAEALVSDAHGGPCEPLDESSPCTDSKCAFIVPEVSQPADGATLVPHPFAPNVAESRTSRCLDRRAPCWDCGAGHDFSSPLSVRRHLALRVLLI